jgi:hypothetical protein
VEPSCPASCFVEAALSAAACDEASFDWCREPPSPSLQTRTGSLVFEAPSCAVPEAAPAACRVELVWPMAWTRGLACSQPHDVPRASCIAVCETGARFAAVADDEASLDCRTDPSLPGLSTRTEMFELLGSTWTACDFAPASCWVPADWVADWTPLPDCACCASCAVPAALPAAAEEEASLDCWTVPSLPGLNTRTEMFELLG